MLDSAEATISSQLQDGEQLLWSGRPRQGLLLQNTDIIVIPTTLLFSGFIFYWEYEVVTTHQFWVLQLWGIPFVLLALFLVIGRFFIDAAVRGKTYYGLTDRRIVSVVGDKTTSYALGDISGMGASAARNGVGNIVFGVPGTTVPNDMSAILGSSRSGWPQWSLIDDARGVRAQIETARQALQTGSAAT